MMSPNCSQLLTLVEKEYLFNIEGEKVRFEAF